MEGMPTTISGFKDHPMYAQFCEMSTITDPPFHSYMLERHLKQTETIYPPPPQTLELGKFRGEPVYPRSAVVSLKTAENWLRSSGRVVREGEQPTKMVKVRPNTINKMRELEVLKDDLKVAGRDSPSEEGPPSSVVAGEVMQGLYAFSQTEIFIPDPVIDVSTCLCAFLNWGFAESAYENRALFRRIILVILIFMCRLCYLPEQFMCHVSFSFFFFVKC